MEQSHVDALRTLSVAVYLVCGQDLVEVYNDFDGLSFHMF